MTTRTWNDDPTYTVPSLPRGTYTLLTSATTGEPFVRTESHHAAVLSGLVDEAEAVSLWIGHPSKSPRYSVTIAGDEIPETLTDDIGRALLHLVHFSQIAQRTAEERAAADSFDGKVVREIARIAPDLRALAEFNDSISVEPAEREPGTISTRPILWWGRANEWWGFNAYADEHDLQFGEITETSVDGDIDVRSDDESDPLILAACIVARSRRAIAEIEAKKA